MKHQAKCFAYGALLLICGFRYNDKALAKPVPLVARHTSSAAHTMSGGAAATTTAGTVAYNCCIKPACAYCKSNSGHAGSAPAGQCHCFEGINAGKTACAECHGGWEAGQGIVPGKTKKDVRKMKLLKP